MPPDAPLPSITGALYAMRHAAEGKSARARDHARRELGVYHAYRQLFFDQEGALREAAQIVLDDMAREAAIGLVSPSLDYAELAAKEGKRRLLLHIFARLELSPERAATLERQLSQEEQK